MDLFETVTTRYGAVTFFANDTGAISESLRKYGEWAENEVSFMLSLLRPGDTVVDVGAYIGTHSMAFARGVGSTGTVVSIEAQASSFEVLSRNMAANGLNNVRLENAVASSSTAQKLIPSINIASPASYGSASLRDVLLSGGGASLPEAQADEVHGVVVKSTAVDDLGLESCALIKIDVEGMEDVVLLGAPRTIDQFKPVIYAECNSLEVGLRTVDAMKRLNYRVRAHVVLAYNAANYREDEENIFGGAREVALVGTPAAGPDALSAYQSRACEYLMDIETADDLALALLNKPQYEAEVLRVGAAARSGGTACLDAIHALRDTVDVLNGKLGQLNDDLHLALDEEERGAHARTEVEEKLRALQEKLEALQENLRASQDTAKRLQAVVDEIHGSSSWRMTAPFRAVSKALSRR